MSRISVPLPNEATRRALVELAEREWRDPRDQAAKLLVEGLERAGVLPAEEQATADRASDRPAVSAA
jgi:hypothetical protein